MPAGAQQVAALSELALQGVQVDVRKLPVSWGAGRVASGCQPTGRPPTDGRRQTAADRQAADRNAACEVIERTRPHRLQTVLDREVSLA
jgi:hypothetical protein